MTARVFAVDYRKETGRAVQIYHNRVLRGDFVCTEYVDWLEKKMEIILAEYRAARYAAIELDH